MITFEDLPPMERQCAECSGKGSIPWTYEQKVPTRGGSKIKTINTTKTCVSCQGKGKHLTPFGESLMQLVKDWSPWDSEFDCIKSDIRDLENREPYDQQRD